MADQESVNLLAAFVAGISGGVFAVAAVFCQNYLTRKQNIEAEEGLVRGYLEAILEEVETLWRRYAETAGSHLTTLPENSPFLFYYPVYQEFFIVYVSNTPMIARVKDSNLRHQIVKTYTFARGLVDSFRLNNYFLEKLENARILAAQSKNSIDAQMVLSRTEAMAKSAAKLKQHHVDLSNQVDGLTRGIRSYLNATNGQ